MLTAPRFYRQSRMLPYLLVLAALPSLAAPNQLTVEALTRKNLTRRLERMPLLPAGTPPVHVCAIPLKEVNASNPERMDPMPHPAGISPGFDPIARPVPVPVCLQH